MIASSGMAGDGRPIVEVVAVFGTDRGFRVSGTACAYEGNVLIDVREAQSDWSHYHTQATIGGPHRGEWSIHIPVRNYPVSLRIGDEDAREGGIALRSQVEFVVEEPLSGGEDEAP